MSSISKTHQPVSADADAQQHLALGVAKAERQWLYAALVILAGLFVAAPAFHGTWLWDDDQEITANGALRTWAGLSAIWSGNAGADFLPLKSTILWIEYHLWEQNNTGYHLITVLAHIINALLVWKLLHKLGLRAAWLGGVLFAVHPVLVESVAWVSEQKNTLSLLLLIPAMLAYINYDEKLHAKNFTHALGAFGWALGLFLASLLCKSSGIMMPVAILLFAWWKRGRLGWNDVWSSVPFFLVALIISIVTIHFQFRNAIGSEWIPVGGYISRTACAGLLIWFYLYCTIFPFDLCPIYPKWNVDPPEWYLFLCWPALLALLWWLWTHRKTWGRHVLFGLGFFLIFLVPVLGFVTMSYMRITWAADHFLYIPAIGLIGLAVATINRLYTATPLEYKKWTLTGFIALFCVLTGFAHFYSGVFANEATMWTYTLSKNENAWQAHSRYGKVLLDSGNIDAAWVHIFHSNRLRPDLAETNNNMGVLLMQKNRPQEAIPFMQRAANIMPEAVPFRLNLANLLANTGHPRESLAHYEYVLQRDPRNPIFHTNFGFALYLDGQRDRAIAEFRTALQIDPNFQSARKNLEMALNNEKPPLPGGPPPTPPAPAPKN
ncbi:MAG: tetratricopeptide repeat protein [Verrucomicrobiales bacterium]|jgi:Flp pilus assembly protein TadD|nr:tetratricopeptide repeat protein [Verrucomicrobiales bacterium]